MKPLTAVYSSPWVPAPLLAACGFSPSPIYSPSDAYAMTSKSPPSEGRCPWSHSFQSLIEGSDFDAAIFATTCDQMRRTAELLSDQPVPVFTLTVPSTRSASSLNFYQSELQRLAAFLSSISGTSPSADEIIESSSRCKARVSEKQAKTPVCVLGSHLPVPFKSFEDLLAKQDAYVAIDGLEAGPAFTPDMAAIPKEASVEDIIDFLGEAYFSQLKDAFSRPNSAFYRWLSVELKREAPKGIIVARNCWCDKWAIEAIRIREWAELPLLELEFTSGELSLSAVSRLEAFMETCRQ